MDKTSPRTPFEHAFTRAIHAAGVQCTLSEQQVEQITVSAWESLTQALGCETVYIPAPSKAQRNAAIIAAWRSGETLAAIAAKHRLTSTRIRQIIEPAETSHDRS